MTRRLLICALLLGLTSTSAVACLWDYDTLKDERRGLPGIAEVLAGRWEKHSRFFYEHRVEKMKALLARDPNNLAAYDNLAVAYEKLDDRPAAVAVMGKKEAVKPGEYTTYANLGTFYLHAGDFENGIANIRKALAINPAAHFGREEYQLKLAEFLSDKSPPRPVNFLGFAAGMRNPRNPDVAAATRAMATQPALAGWDAEDIAIWLYRGRPEQIQEWGLKANVFDGVVGMIRFGTGTSAELYLTLGDLLALRGDKNLAYRAYQRALDLGHPRRAYLDEVMKNIREYLVDKSSIEASVIQSERAAADAWVKAFQDYEDSLIRRGKDVDDEANYAPFYKQHGPVVRAESFSPADLLPRDPFAQIAVFAAMGIILFLLAVCFAIRWVRRRRKFRRVPA